MERNLISDQFQDPNPKPTRQFITPRFFKIIAIVVIIAAIPLTIILSKNRQDIRQRAAALDVSVPRYSLFERTIPWTTAGYTNPWEQVTVSMILTSPSNKQTTVGGFYYQANTYKARFAPTEIGTWSWRTTITDGATTNNDQGSFNVTDSSYPGFVRSNPVNKNRWVFDNGQSYNPIGIGDCMGNNDQPTDLLGEWGFDGGFRPAGVETGTSTDIDTYMRAYGSAGVNLFRWSVDNCAFGLYRSIEPQGNVYRERESIAGDTLTQKLRQYGLRTYMVMFGFNPPGAIGSPYSYDYPSIKRYVKYVVDRYGASVDYWELMNEAVVGPEWYAEIIPYLRSIDPYKHPISTSYEKPDTAGIEINSPLGF